MSQTKIHELTIALVVTPQDDAMGSTMPLLTHDEVMQNAEKIIRAYVDHAVPPGHLATMVVASDQREPKEKEKKNDSDSV